MEKEVEPTVDPNAVLPCEGVGVQGCPGVPVWAMHLQACGHQVFLCATCTQEVRRIAATHRRPIWFAHGPGCEVRNYRWIWRLL